MRRAALVSLFCGLTFGQAPTGKPAFEVVSIKRTTETLPSVMQSGRKPMQIDDAQAILRGFPLSMVVQMAYGLPDDQVTGPAWMAEERFEIMAKLPAGFSREQVPEMLRAMLAERFKMTVHHEERVRPVYLLVVGKGRLELKESAGGDPDRQGCNGGRGGHYACRNVTMEEFAGVLSRTAAMNAMAPVGTASGGLDRPVVDKTGLKGAYDFTMDYGRVGGPTGGRRGDAAPADTVVTEVPVAEAVKALGLALEPARQPFEILVVDRIERTPTAN